MIERYLRDLVKKALEYFGCTIIEHIEKNLIKVKIPSESPISGVLELKGQVYVALVEFDENFLAGYKPVCFLTTGSYYLGKLVSFLSKQAGVPPFFNVEVTSKGFI